MLAGFFDVIILMGALQGFIVSGLLFFSTGKRVANRLLAAFIFFIALACLNLFISGQKWASAGHFWPLVLAVVPMVLVMPLGPLLLFYTKAAVEPDFRLSRKDRLQFIPAMIDLCPYLVALVYILAVLSRAIKGQAFNAGLFIDTYNVYADIPRWLSLTIYLTATVQYLSKFGKTAGATGWVNQLKWLKQLTIAIAVFQTIWLLYLVPYVIPAYSNKLLNLVDWYPIYVPMAILIYWLGIKGYLAMQEQPLIVKKVTVMADSDAERIITKLKEAMEQDSLYLNPDLNLTLLSAHCAIPQKTISAVLNQHQGQNFNDFVNGYRVNVFKQRVGADAYKHLTIAGIAAECGFNSQATFQRIFKQFTGMSPSAYKLQTAKMPERVLKSGFEHS